MWHDDDRTWDLVERVLFTNDRVASAEAEIERLVALAGVAPGSRVLDLCCGVGRHSAALARRGFAVTAVDRTARYLARARRDHADAAVEWVHADARAFRRDGAFDAAVNLWTSFGYFDDPADDRRVVENLRAGLRPGGVLVMELNGRETLARTWQPRSWTTADGVHLLEDREVVDDWTRVVSRWTVIDDEGRGEVTLRIRLYAGSELRALLRDVGFGDVRLYGGLDGSPYGADARRLVAVAR